jgi:hypothetical protein
MREDEFGTAGTRPLYRLDLGHRMPLMPERGTGQKTQTAVMATDAIVLFDRLPIVNSQLTSRTIKMTK